VTLVVICGIDKIRQVRIIFERAYGSRHDLRREIEDVLGDIPSCIEVSCQAEHWMDKRGWHDLIFEDLVPLGCRLATFDSMSAHVCKESRLALKDAKIISRIGPPNGTDLWQSNDQLTNKYLRRAMRRLTTQHGLDYADDLKKNGEIPRPSNAEFVTMVAKAVKRVNQKYSKRIDPDTGEEIRTPGRPTLVRTRRLDSQQTGQSKAC